MYRRTARAVISSRWPKISTSGRATIRCLAQTQSQPGGSVFGGAATAAPPPLFDLPPDVHKGSIGVNHDEKTLKDIFDNAGVWKDFSARVHSSSEPRRGLFQNKDLTSPAGFKRYTERTLAKAQAVVSKIVAAETEDELASVVTDLDLLSDLLCRVIDMSEFVRSTHPDRKIVAAADRSFAAMFEYMNVLNTTTGLYTALSRALSTPAVVARLSSEERAVARILMKDFEKSGITLLARSRARFVELSNDIAQLGQQFVNDMRPARDYLHFESHRLRGMDPLLVRELASFGRTRVPCSGMTAHHALRTVVDEDVRRVLYQEMNTAAPEQISILETLLERRAQLAQLTGAESYAHVALADKMAATPEAVQTFISALSTANLPHAQADLEILTALKHVSGSPGPLQPWDRDYYMARHLHAQRSRQKSPDDLSAFLSLGTVIQGLSRLFTRLFGLRLVPVEPAPGETWNSDVRRLDVVSDTDGHIAVVYCDLFARPGKNPNPAHFTVRCARRINPSEATPDSPDPTDGMASATHPHTRALHQLPTIALICDFASKNSNTPTLLAFRDVSTLFHEMGHALHSIVGRTALHNVAGTRCATDWAELPSILMEHFAFDPRVLSLFARHWATGQPIPGDVIAENLLADETLLASETRAQIMMARLDQELHTLTNGQRVDSTHAYARVFAREMLGIPYTPPTSWQGFFGHLFGYGATYYAYLFDRAIASQVWRTVFVDDPLDRASGERYANEVLRWGGSRDAWKCLEAVLGDKEGEGLEEGGTEAMRRVGMWGGELK